MFQYQKRVQKMNTNLASLIDNYSSDPEYYDSLYGVFPEASAESLYEYVQNGRRTGDFLEAVLVNDLYAAVNSADSTNSNLLREYVMFLYNHVPMVCRGSLDRYRKWVERGGLQGGRRG